jgi:hypothetical protein
MTKVIITSLIILSCLFCQAQSKSKPDTIIIYLSEKLLFEAKLDADSNLMLTKVDVLANKEITISIELTYGNSLGGSLVINNPFPKPLRYKAELYSYMKGAYNQTSVAPAFPNVNSYETWPYKIDKIRLSGFTLKE